MASYLLRKSSSLHWIKRPFLTLTDTLMPPKARSRPSSDLAAFRDLWSKSKHIVALTGAGISAESGVPTFRGEGGLWRKYQATSLATPEAFSSNPSLVWEFYSYRRELVLTKEPNDAHRALAAAEKSLKAAGKRLVIITQNIDELHRRAGSENVIELHGTLFKTQCTRCGHVAVNHDSPIVPALADKGSPDPGVMDSQIPISELPKCGKCNGLVRPNVVWFGEPLDPNVLEAVQSELDKCDLCLVIGTSSIVYPAAMFAPQCVSKGIPVAEFNIDETHTTDQFGFHFTGPCGKTLPPAIKD